MWTARTIDRSARTSPAGACAFRLPCEIEVVCIGGDFGIDLVGFPTGHTITRCRVDGCVPEPASLVLLGTGLGLGAAFISRRRRKSRANA